MEYLLNQGIFSSSLWELGATTFQTSYRKKVSIPETLANWRREPFKKIIANCAWDTFLAS